MLFLQNRWLHLHITSYDLAIVKRVFSGSWELYIYLFYSCMVEIVYLAYSWCRVKDGGTGDVFLFKFE